MAKCSNLGTRTRADVAAKDSAKTKLATVARQTVDLCQACTWMTPQKRQQLQIPQRSSKRTPTPVPATAPMVMVASTSPISIRVMARDVKDPSRRAKPAGVRQLEIRSMIGGEPVGDPLTRANVDLSGKTDYDMVWPAQSSATTVWVSCCWVNGRNERGPMSEAVSVRLAGTGYASATQARVEEPTMKIAA